MDEATRAAVKYAVSRHNSLGWRRIKVLLDYIESLEETVEVLSDADVMTAIEEARRYA